MWLKEYELEKGCCVLEHEVLNTADFVIKKGEKMAQGIFLPYLLADGDNATGVRTGGIGSTGK